jgi:3-dehydroshikimate dehydratase
MLTPGLVSVTFRSLGPEEIIRLAGEAKLNSIKWGGDIHVPVGDIHRAREVGRWTRDAGLRVAAYGSYYRLGATSKQTDSASFERVLASAETLGASTIRVWAGNKGSADCSTQERSEIIRDGLRVAELAAQVGISISIEYHDGTLTDTRDSVAQLLAEWVHPNVEFLWQPSNGEEVESCAARLRDVLPRLRNVHVFHWWPTSRERHSLELGEARWRTYIDVVSRAKRPIDFLLEFVAEDSPEHLLRDALVLRQLLLGAQ